MKDDLKDYRGKELKSYAISLGIIIYIIVTDELEVSKIDELMCVADSVLVASVITSLIYIFDGLLDTKVKNIINLIFKIPGDYVFSKLIPSAKDYRIDLKKAKEKYKKIYSKLEEGKKTNIHFENESWYKIYKKYEEIPMVKVSQREYLLLRDMSVVNCLMLLVYIALVIFKFVKFNFGAGILILGLYVLTIIGANIKARKLCLNVIAQDLSAQD